MSKTSPIDLIKYLKQVLEAMVIYGRDNVFHSELNPKNIYIKDSMAKIVDLGKSISYKDNPSKYDMIFWSPELSTNKDHISEKIDVYNWAMMLYQASTKASDAEVGNDRRTKIKSQKNHDAFLVKVDKIKVKDDVDGSLTDMVIKVLKKALIFSPTERATF